MMTFAYNSDQNLRLFFFLIIVTEGVLIHLSMESVQCLLYFVVFQGKSEYETIAKKFESFHSNHLKPKSKKCNKSNKIGPMHRENRRLRLLTKGY